MPSYWLELTISVQALIRSSGSAKNPQSSFPRGRRTSLVSTRRATSATEIIAIRRMSPSHDHPCNINLPHLGRLFTATHSSGHSPRIPCFVRCTSRFQDGAPIPRQRETVVDPDQLAEITPDTEAASTLVGAGWRRAASGQDRSSERFDRLSSPPDSDIRLAYKAGLPITRDVE